MRLVVDDRDSSVTLEQPDVFTEFAVRVPRGMARDSVNRVLTDSGVGELVGDHAWIRDSELAGLARAQDLGAEWEVGFTRMLAYARSKGWQRDDGAVRAHLEFDGAG